jgi:hypothetical protein
MRHTDCTAQHYYTGKQKAAKAQVDNTNRSNLKAEQLHTTRHCLQAHVFPLLLLVFPCILD